MKEILRELAVQRWDDHRYYHHSRINQSLHLLSAVSFLVAYVLLFINPAAAAILGWCVSMPSRPAGHFLFDPLCFEQGEPAHHQFKEGVKNG